MSGDNLEAENADLKKRLAAVREVLGRVTNELEAHLGGPQDQNEEESALLHDARLALTDAFDLDELRLHRLHIDGAGVEMEVSSQKVVQGLAALMARTLDDLGAKNYVQQELSLSTSEFVLLVQRRAGKTPHTLRLEAEAERDDLKKRLAAADEQLRIATERVEFTQNVADREHESVMRLSRANDEVAAALRACEAKLQIAETTKGWVHDALQSALGRRVDALEEGLARAVMKLAELAGYFGPFTSTERHVYDGLVAAVAAGRTVLDHPFIEGQLVRNQKPSRTPEGTPP